jgi:hypothetical protein
MLEIIAEGVESVTEGSINEAVLPEAIDQQKDSLDTFASLELINLKLDPGNRACANSSDATGATTMTSDWRKRRIGLTHLEENWRPQLGLETTLQEEEEEEEMISRQQEKDRHSEDDQYEDPDLERKSDLDEELESWRERSGSRNARHVAGSDRHPPGRGLLGVDFGMRRAKSPVTVQASCIKPIMRQP